MNQIKPIRQFHFGESSAVTSGPASEPLTATEVKNWLKVTGTSEDDLISSLIAAARKQVEHYTNLKLFTQTIAEYWDEWPYSDELKNRFGGLSLSWGPVQSVSSVQYTDEDGDTQTFSSSNYTTDLTARPARIAPGFDDVWPTARLEPNSIRVMYVAGYSDTADIPDDIKTAMRLMITHWYDNRTDSVRQLPMASECLLRPYKLGVYV